TITNKAEQEDVVAVRRILDRPERRWAKDSFHVWLKIVSSQHKFYVLTLGAQVIKRRYQLVNPTAVVNTANEKQEVIFFQAKLVDARLFESPQAFGFFRRLRKAQQRWCNMHSALQRLRCKLYGVICGVF